MILVYFFVAFSMITKVFHSDAFLKVDLSMFMLCRNGFSRIVGHPTGGSEEVS